MRFSRMARQHLIHLQSQVKAGHLAPEEAGRKLASHLKERYPLLIDALILRWCTAKFGKSIPMPDVWVATDLWKPEQWRMPLREIGKQLDGTDALQGRFSAKQADRRADWRAMLDIVGGDDMMTPEQAYQLAHPEEETG